MLRRLSLRLLLPAVALLAVMVIPSLAGYYTDFLWFSEVGEPQVFTTTVTAQLAAGAIVFLIAATWLFLNLRVALGAIGDRALTFTTREGFPVVLPGRRQLQPVVLIVALLVAGAMALVVAGQWMTWLAWRHAVPFGQHDPILGLDVSFYVFTLPFFDLVRGLAITMVVLAAIGAGAVYLLAGGLTLGGSISDLLPSGGGIGAAARRHLSVLAAVFLLLLAFGAWLDQPRMLLNSSGLLHGATYADVNVRLPVARLLVVAAAIGACLAAINAFVHRAWHLPAAAVLYLVVAFGGEGYATLIQRFVVTPNEQVREIPYILHNIGATRRAFALDHVEERELTGDASLTRDDVARNAATLDNVRLWDHQPLLDTFGQIQEIRTYYDFVSVDNDRYTINGDYRQVMLSARELNPSSLPNRTWVNERLTFTHGYGLTLGPVNQVTQEGLPRLFIRDLPPVSDVDLTVSEPSIYFGELSNDYVIVGTKAREFHYPKGDDNVFTAYNGRGGVPVGSLWRKLLLSARFRAYQILLSDDITPESRILFNRNIRDRVRTIAPFLAFDNDPYMVVSGGRLYWMYDAYTTSDRYPYSTPATGGINYIRNAVKVVIDAYHGTTTFYLADPRDPIAATYARIFPGFLKPLAEMPEGLRRHVRYPEDIFAIQSVMYSTYHMTSPAALYNREDQWEVPTLNEINGAAQAMQPYYTIMKLPGERRAEFIQMLPFTPRRKDNLAAWLVARSDGEEYGHLLAFQFPKQKVVFGPRQVVARINQDQTISPQITLWNQQGSEVIQGTLMVIPVEESLIYVRPLYLRSSGGRIPELTRVIVAYQNQIVMERTLAEALDRIFGRGSGTALVQEAPAVTDAPGTTKAPVAPPVTTATPALVPGLDPLAAEARDHYDRAIQAQRNGDWATYGDEIRKLGEVIGRMNPKRR